MLLDVSRIRQAIRVGQIEWRKHTLQRLAERQISQKDVLQVLLFGEIIQEYTDDRPFPSMLVFGWIDVRPLHVVASYDSIGDVVYIITVYEPSTEIFESDFKTRKQ